MKRTLTLVIAMLSLCFASKAQSAMGNPQNTEYPKMDGVGGHFDYIMSARERMNVNYSLTPAHPADKAKLFLHTPEAMPLWATVTNKEGKVVLTWKPEVKNYIYNAELNISKFKSGDYTVNIYMGDEKNSIHTINFTKQ